jgi:DNA mismatch endonuclease, patch repair protein
MQKAFVTYSTRLPGKPDIVLPKYRAVIFVHGCFWHGHDCHLFKWPKTRMGFWRKKIERNREIDESAIAALEEVGWRGCVIWECSLKSPTRLPIAGVVERIVDWLGSNKQSLTIRGRRVVKAKSGNSLIEWGDRLPMTLELENISLSEQIGNDVSTLLVVLLEQASNVLVKKLSNNDRDWAQFSNKHQAGVYIPPKQRDGGFFPPLAIKERPSGAAEISNVCSGTARFLSGSK